MFWLGHFGYKSKQDLLDKLKAFLQGAPQGRVSHEEADRKLRLLIAMHPNAERKIGLGIDHFKIVRNVRGAGQGIHIVRTDGSEEPFSYKRCISGVVQSAHGKVCEALRFTVQPQLKQYRESITLPVTCKLSGLPVERRRDLHIDHARPFWRLLRDFCTEHGVDLSVLETTGSGESLQLVDEDVALAFERYHREHAVLQPSLKSANAAKGGRLKFSAT
jgi:hypothetical protein